MNVLRMTLVCGLVLFGVLGSVQAQEKYPTRLIEFVVQSAPGGSADVAARLYTDELAKALKVPITAVNRAGGAGIQGVTYVTRAEKDGYTLLQGSGTSIIILPLISKEATYDPLKDLVPLGHFVSVPTVLAVRSDSPFKTLAELIEYARKNPEKLKNSTGGLGTFSYFNLELLCVETKVKITTIPFKSGGEALPALLGGHVDMASNTLTTLGPQIAAGKVRGLAITSKKRDPDFPNLPTTAELGYPNVSFSTWFGVFAPAGVPQSVTSVLVPALEKIFKDPEVVKRAEKAQFTVDYKGPDEFRKFIEREITLASKVAEGAKLAKE